MIAAYHSLHLKAIKFDKNSSDDKSIYYKVYQRHYVKWLIRLMFTEGVVLELLLLLVSANIQYDLD